MARLPVDYTLRNKIHIYEHWILLVSHIGLTFTSKKVFVVIIRGDSIVSVGKHDDFNVPCLDAGVLTGIRGILGVLGKLVGKATEHIACFCAQLLLFCSSTA